MDMIARAMAISAKGGTVNVKDFGAKGDGVTDDTAAIQAAINNSYNVSSYLGETTGKILFFPLGVYKLTSPLVIPSNAGISFIGQGKTKSNIYQSVSNTDAFQMSGNNYRGVFKGLRITGPSGQTSGTGAAINIQNHGNQIYVEDCWINCFGYGVLGNPTSDSNFINNVFEYVHRVFKITDGQDFNISNNMFYNCGPVSCGGSEQEPTMWFINVLRITMHGNRIINDASVSPQSGGFYKFDGCTSVILSDELMNSNTTLVAVGVLINASTDVKIHNCTFGKLYEESIKLTGVNKKINITDNLFYGSQAASYRTITATSAAFEILNISGNIFDSGSSATYDIVADTGKELIITRNKLNGGYAIDPGCKAFPFDNFGGTYKTYLSAAPIYNTWSAGDKIYLPSPTSGGYIGYVCTVTGTPGTWKGFGTIQS